ncbi:MAG TPA: MFS transporter [Candidatus Eisenbacteria bacterium]|nr:MFS transporter [Candidatus Eisenbacteria bacterium]
MPPWLNRTVLAFGVASLLSDAGHETATAVLPLFLVSLGGSAASLGFVEGISDALSTAAKLLAGWYSDGLRHRRPIGVVGYAATGIGMAALALARVPSQVLGVRAASWVGRGMRGPVRDAMLAEAVPATARGRAFGFHRAMDTVGAVLGPLLALLLLGRFGYRTIFLATLVPGILSIAAFASAPELGKPRRRPPLRASLADLPAPFRRFLVAVFLFGLGDFARSLLILRAVSLLGSSSSVPPERMAVAMYALHNLVHACSSYGIGVLGERVGARRVLAAGYAAYAAMALGFVAAADHPGIVVLAGLFVLAGVAMAAEEVLEATVAADLLPEGVRGTGYGALAAVNGVGDLVASSVVGALWVGVSPAAGFTYAAMTGAAGALAMLRLR